MGSFVSVNAQIKGRVHISSFFLISDATFFGPVVVGSNVNLIGVSVDKFTYFAGNSLLLNSTVGPFCSIASGVSVGLPTHSIHGISTSPIFFHNVGKCGVKWCDNNLVDELFPVCIGADVWIGANALIKGGVSTGIGIVTSAGAVVAKDVPPCVLVGEVPAKIIKYRFPDDVI